jgi:mono/diheme cytochrome c family protein
MTRTAAPRGPARPARPPASTLAGGVGLALLLAGVPWAAAGQSADPAAGPLGLGRPATADEITALDIDVMPDGTGLPLGGGSAAEGARVWGGACRSCHGREGEGSIAAPLVGRDPAARPPTVGNYWPYATTLYDYIYRAMPRNAPGTLSPDEVYGLVAWILAKNSIIDDQAVMNAATLPDVVMPARDRFDPDDRLASDAVR